MIQSLDREELRRLLTAAKEHSERDWLMILVGFWHGLRASEVVKIKPDDVRDGYLSVRRLKGSLHTDQPLLRSDDPLFSEADALIELAVRTPGNQRLFPITRQHFWKLFQAHAKRANIPERKRHSHILKHSIAMQTIHSAGIENVRQYLGHKSISSTGAYLKVSDEDAARAVQGTLGRLNFESLQGGSKS